MYVRERSEPGKDQKPEPLTLAVSGMLWNRSLVMVDTETESLWSHLLGKAMEGELKGTVLETLPATMVSWQSWKKDHPGTTVTALSRTSQRFLKEFHADEGRFVLGLRSLSKSKSYGLDTLKKTPVINDEFNGDPVVVVFRAESAGGRAFLRTLDEAGEKDEPVALDFESKLAKQGEAERMKDRGTGSLWNPETGVCEQGSLKGKQLKEIPAIISFRKAWEAFYPDDERFRD